MVISRLGDNRRTITDVVTSRKRLEKSSVVSVYVEKKIKISGDDSPTVLGKFETTLVETLDRKGSKLIWRCFHDFS